MNLLAALTRSSSCLAVPQKLHIKLIGVTMHKPINTALTAHILLSLIMAMPSNSLAAELISISPAQLKSLHITVAGIEPASSISSQRLPGEIVVPITQSRMVSAPQPGLIDSIMVASGERVRKGQVLAHLSSPELVGLQRDHLQALSQQRLSQNSLNRDAELYKDGIIAERRYLTTQSNHHEVNAQLAERRQALKLSGMSNQAISQLEASGSYANGMNLLAPIDGVVLEQMVTAGQRVDVSMPIYHIAHLSPLWLEIHAPVQLINQLAIGMQVKVANTSATGKIIAIVRNINKLDQTALVRVEISTGTHEVSPGQMVEAEIQQASVSASFSVAKSAVVQKGTGKDANAHYVFIQTTQGFEVRQVVLVSSAGAQAIIRAEDNTPALIGNEKVVTAGTTALKAKWLGLGSE